MKPTQNQLLDIFADLCLSCKKDCDREARYRDHVYMPGCYPWDCIHATVALKDHPDAGIRVAVEDHDMAFTPCPITGVNTCKGHCLGCPKMSKDGTGEFCEFGVRRVDIVPNETGRCRFGRKYEFDENAEFNSCGVGYIVRYTKLAKVLPLNEKLNVYAFALCYPPKRLKECQIMTVRDFNTIARHMSVFGYEEKDGTWHKRSPQEQEKWVANCRFSYEWRSVLNGDNSKAEETQAQNKES